MKGYQAFLLVVVLLLIDQATKIWVKTHMFLGEEISIAGWLEIYFTENPGMAFSMKLPGVWGKLFLSGFRLVAVGGGAYFIYYLLKQKAHWGVIAASSMILSGAIGNMIDGSVYGVIFSDSYMRVATVFPEGGGYAGLMQGLVVDMIHVRLPGFNGQELFPFIFNIADAAITVGVFLILIFQKSFFKAANKSTGEAALQQVNLSN